MQCEGGKCLKLIAAIAAAARMGQALNIASMSLQAETDTERQSLLESGARYLHEAEFVNAVGESIRMKNQGGHCDFSGQCGTLVDL